MPPNISLPGALAPTFWNKPKAELDKAPKAPDVGAPMEDDLKTIGKRHDEVKWEVFNTDKLKTVAEVEERIKVVEEQHKSKVLRLMSQVESTAGKAADLVKACKGNKQLGTSYDAAGQIVKATASYGSMIKDAVESTKSDLKALLAKLKASEKKGPAPAGVSKVESKGAKLVRARALESIRKVRKPKPGQKPVRCMVVEFKKVVRVYLGPQVGTTQEKLLRGLINEKPVKVHKDIRSEVIWEKAALTVVSDRIPLGLAKKVQLAIKVQFKLPLKLRLRKTTGEVEEGENAPDLAEDQLKADPAEEKAAMEAGKAFAARLKAIGTDLANALKTRPKDDVDELRKLVVSIQTHGKNQEFADAASELDDLEAMLDETPGEDEGDDEAAAPGDKGQPGGVPPAKAFGAKLAALRSKIDAAVAAGGATAKQIKDYAEAAEKLVKTEVAANIDRANTFLTKVEQMLGDAAAGTGGGGLSVKQLATARLEWLKTRDAAIKEIGFLSKAISAVFAKETVQAPKVDEATRKLDELSKRLKSGLDSDLDAALNESDPARRVAAAAKARASLASIRKFVEEDELMASIDNNEIVKTMSVVGPMKTSLKAIEAALGR